MFGEGLPWNFVMIFFAIGAIIGVNIGRRQSAQAEAKKTEEEV